MRELESIFQLYGVNSPTSETPLVANLLYADVCEKVGLISRAGLACSLIAHDVQNRLSYDSKNMKKANIDYIMFRCKWLIARLSQADDTYETWGALFSGVTFDSLRVDDVSDYLMSMFPMRPEEARIVDRFYLS